MRTAPTQSAIPERYLQRVLAGEPVTFERRGSIRRGEEPRFFQTELIPDLDRAGAVRGYYAMTSDVTERKRTELSLAHSEAQIRTIADNIPALVSHVDASLHYTFVNAQGQGAAPATRRWSASRCPRSAARRTSRSSSPTTGARSRGRR